MDVSPAEVVESLAFKEAFGVYRGLSERQAKEIVALKQELARYAAAAPEKTATQAAGGVDGGSKPGGFDLARMFGRGGGTVERKPGTTRLWGRRSKFTASNRKTGFPQQNFANIRN